MQDRLQSRLGFLMLAAGCAVGLGNVWRFPFVVAKNGGATFILVYLLFLGLLGFPLLTTELALGRGSGQGISGALSSLAVSRKKLWGILGSVVFFGNVLLMIYYTTVAGWLECFTVGYLINGSAPNIQNVSGGSVSASFMVAAVFVSASVCALGLSKGVERITKFMMVSLLFLIGAMAIKAVTLPGAMVGVERYLKPEFSMLFTHPFEFCFDAMAQAFFTLSVGVGAMTIFGSYITRSNTLAKESVSIIVIDTLVALLSGLIIFAAGASGKVLDKVLAQDGPTLIFSVLPNVFAHMSAGRLWGALFFFFLSLAALTTIIAVFECIIAGFQHLFKLSRIKSVGLTFVVVALGGLPTAIFTGVLSIEDFIFSKFYLPLGGLLMCFFVSLPSGWKFDKFLEEINSGQGLRLPRWTIVLYKLLLPILIVSVMVCGVIAGLGA